MAGLINKEDELARLAKEVAKDRRRISRIENKLANEVLCRLRTVRSSRKSVRSWKAMQKRKLLIEQQAVIAAL